MDPQSAAYLRYVESIKQDACGYVTQKLPSVLGKSSSNSGVTEAITAVVNSALKVVEVTSPLLTAESIEYVRAEVLKTRHIEMAKRQKEWEWNEKREQAAQRREANRKKANKRKVDQETERLRLERGRIIVKKWYKKNRKKENAKSQMRNREKQNPHKKCCPYKMLDVQAGPERGDKVWVTKCLTCNRKEYGQFGFDENKREGLSFCGVWFKDIDPVKGTGTTFDNKNIDLTRVY